MKDRISARFAALRAEGRTGLVTFLTAGDPDAPTSQLLFDGLPKAGADLIEMGMPFSDPMADGPAIQAAGLRALRAGATMERTFDQVAAFRRANSQTPVVLMGYFNPIYSYGTQSFIDRAAAVGVDGAIIVDLPPEEDEEFRRPARRAGLHLIRLATPTTIGRRLSVVLDGASGFVYYVAVAGTTGTKSGNVRDVRDAVERLRRATDLPVAVGFGIRTPDQAAAVAEFADAAVVGTALVDVVAERGDGTSPAALAEALHAQVANLARGVRNAKD